MFNILENDRLFYFFFRVFVSINFDVFFIVDYIVKLLFKLIRKFGFLEYNVKGYKGCKSER